MLTFLLVVFLAALGFLARRVWISAPDDDLIGRMRDAVSAAGFVQKVVTPAIGKAWSRMRTGNEGQFARLQRRAYAAVVRQVQRSDQGVLLLPSLVEVRLSRTDSTLVAPYSHVLEAELGNQLRGWASKFSMPLGSPLRIVTLVDSSLATGDVGVRLAQPTETIGAPKAPTTRMSTKPMKEPTPVLVYNGMSVPLRMGSTHIGRSPECDVLLLDAQASGMHCRIDRSNNGIIVTDLDSTNGTTLNSNVITSAPASVGDQILVGRTMITIGSK